MPTKLNGTLVNGTLVVQAYYYVGESKTNNIMMIIIIIIRAKRVSGDVAGGGGAPTNDYDDGSNYCYHSIFYYLPSKLCFQWLR